MHQFLLNTVMAEVDVEFGEDAHAEGIDGLGRHTVACGAMQ
jgi:hypothetical protein